MVKNEANEETAFNYTVSLVFRRLSANFEFDASYLSVIELYSIEKSESIY